MPFACRLKMRKTLSALDVFEGMRVLVELGLKGVIVGYMMKMPEL